MHCQPLRSRLCQYIDEDVGGGDHYYSQMSPNRLFRCHMIDVGSRNAESAVIFGSTARTSAVRFDRAEVVGECCVAQVESPCGSDSVAEALVEGSDYSEDRE